MAENAMDSKSQFYALEVMCHERAAVARKEMEYWLNEAQEWEQLRKLRQNRCRSGQEAKT
jgi:hypothetical protein